MPRSGAMLCPSCRKLINRDEPRCPHCNLSNPGAGWKQYLRGVGPLSADNAFTYLLYLNVGMFVLSLLLVPRQIGVGLNPFALLSPSSTSLLLLGSTGTVPIDQLGRWWTLLSANYLHGSLLHIFFNMAALRQLAPLTLREFGLHRTVTIYTLGGVGGFLVSYLAGVPRTIGASAALCALMGALLFYGRNRGGAYGQAVFQSIKGWALGVLVFGFLVPGINNWAHGGGLLAGYLLAAALGYQERGRTRWGHRVLAGTCIAVTLAALAWGVTTGLLVRFRL